MSNLQVDTRYPHNSWKQKSLASMIVIHWNRKLYPFLMTSTLAGGPCELLYLGTKIVSENLPAVSSTWFRSLLRGYLLYPFSLNNSLPQTLSLGISIPEPALFSPLPALLETWDRLICLLLSFILIPLIERFSGSWHIVLLAEI